MQNAHAKSVISICEFPFPIQRAFVKDDNGNLSYREPKFAPMRSQDLKSVIRTVAYSIFMTNPVLSMLKTISLLAMQCLVIVSSILILLRIGIMPVLWQKL